MIGHSRVDVPPSPDHMAGVSATAASSSARAGRQAPSSRAGVGKPRDCCHAPLRLPPPAARVPPMVARMSAMARNRAEMRTQSGHARRCKSARARRKLNHGTAEGAGKTATRVTSRVRAYSASSSLTSRRSKPGQGFSPSRTAPVLPLFRWGAPCSPFSMRDRFAALIGTSSAGAQRRGMAGGGWRAVAVPAVTRQRRRRARPCRRQSAHPGPRVAARAFRWRCRQLGRRYAAHARRPRPFAAFA